MPDSVEPSTSSVGASAPTLPWAEDDFEQRLAIATARSKLFGGSPSLTIGHYRVIERVGAGGMGEIYRAFDSELEREVAIKRVRDDSFDAEQQRRLRNEARTLARLSHPNVVQVHEVGEHEGRTFIAMEFVAGVAASTWLTTPRAPREILAMFVSAGRGLAAAHAAGVVHRDFKPDNVVVGDDGRVRVVDFGLALAGDPSGGEVAGTIRYMAPEQLRGASIDARSDQFGFCVALYEALWAQPPFELADAAARLAAIERGPLRPRRLPGLSARVWPLLRRGLQHEPSERWASLDELLDALDSIPRRRRRLATLAGLMVTALASAWLVHVASAPPVAPSSPCEGIELELTEVWTPAAQATLRERLATLPAAHASESAQEVADGLDRWMARWLDTRTRQCEAAATQVDEPPIALARRRCLVRQLQVATRVIATLQVADSGMLARAVRAVAALPDPEDCGSTQILFEAEPPASAQLEAVDDVRAALADLRARRQLGRGAPLDAQAWVERARELGHRPTLAEALAERGHTELDAGSAERGLALLEDAAELALGIDHRRLLADTLTSLATHRSGEYPREDARLLVELAEGAWLDLQPSPAIRSRLELVHGRLSEGRAQVEHLEHAMALSFVIERPAITGELAGVRERRGELELALALRERALAEATTAFGPRHPETAKYHFNLGIALRGRGETARAQRELEQAVDIWQHAHDRPHPDLARAHRLLAEEALHAGELELAERHAHEVEHIHALTLPPGHPDFGDAPLLLGRIAAHRGEPELAIAHARRALALYERGDHDETSLELRLEIAGSELALGRFAAASREYEALLATGAPANVRALANVGLAEVALREHRLDEARSRLDQATRMSQSNDFVAISGYASSHAIVDGLVELRRGCRSCADELHLRIADAMHEDGTSPSQLEAWLETLAMTTRERERLGLVP